MLHPSCSVTASIPMMDVVIVPFRKALNAKLFQGHCVLRLLKSPQHTEQESYPNHKIYIITKLLLKSQPSLIIKVKLINATISSFIYCCYNIIFSQICEFGLGSLENKEAAEPRHANEHIMATFLAKVLAYPAKKYLLRWALHLPKIMRRDLRTLRKIKFS